MLHHISLPVLDLDRSTQLYDATLSELGYRRVCSGGDFAGYGVEDGKDKFAIKQVRPAACAGPRFHLAFTAPSRESVDRFHATALRHGATDDGRPALRRHYGPAYYAAFIIDLDGHRIEAVINDPVAAPAGSPWHSQSSRGGRPMGSDPRLDLIHAVQTVMANDQRIDGLVVIGSGAVGFRDELSDVDLIAAVAPGLDPATVGDELARDLRSCLPLYRYIQTPPARARGIHVFLLEGHMELDLSFVSTAELRATTDRWRIVFDREGEVARQMSIPLPDRPLLSEQARFRYLAGCGSLWFGLKALQRNEHLLATDRLGEVRSHIAALVCLDTFGTDEQVAQRADTLPEASRVMLQSLVCKATAPELGRAFRAAIAALSHYDQTLLQSKLDDNEYAGLAEWLSLRYPPGPRTDVQ